LQNLELRKGEVDNVTINEKDLIVMQKQVWCLILARVKKNSFSSDALF
jgi:hypothetical protein